MARPTRGSATLPGAGAASPKELRAQPRRRDADTIVVGAGVFGAWTAARLRAEGRKVLLVDAWGPGHARASSGGESRMTRGAYGGDEIYSRMARDSLEEWRALSARADLPLFHETGVLFFFPEVQPFLEETMRVHRQLGLPTALLDTAAMRRDFPQFDFTGIAAGLYEPGFGTLMARRAVQSLVAEFVRRGGTYRQAEVAPPEGTGEMLTQLRLGNGETLRAASFVFACGAWLGRLFPELLGRRIFPTRQEIFFFAPPPGDRDFTSGRLPGWADFNHGDMYYGFPDLEGRGVKVAHDRHGPGIDPDAGDRLPTAAALAEVRAFMALRLPALADRPLSEARVCQYENSSNGDFLIDRHPDWANVVLVGAGSGHGFKHGPAVGRYAADLLLDRLATPEPRFGLASKSEAQQRVVH